MNKSDDSEPVYSGLNPNKVNVSTPAKKTPVRLTRKSRPAPRVIERLRKEMPIPAAQMAGTSVRAIAAPGSTAENRGCATANEAVEPAASAIRRSTKDGLVCANNKVEYLMSAPCGSL